MFELKFIDVGEGITEGHIQKWLVNDGDRIAEDQSILQIETDKAVVNIPAAIAGIIKIVVPDNSDVHVGDTMAFIGEPDELKNAVPTKGEHKEEAQRMVEKMQSVTPISQPAQQQAPQPKPQQAQHAPASNEPLATPAVRKMAREMGIDLTTVKGTGPNGRILDTDLKGGASPQAPAPAPTASPSGISFGGQVERMPMSPVRKAIARNMELSWTIPRAAHMDLINASRLYMIVKREKANAETKGIKLTFLPYIIKATIQALKENPRFNSSYDKERQEIILKKYYNIGIAVQSDDGLKVLVIKNADTKGILTIAKEIDDLHKKVMNGTISLDEMKDSTFTITNIGSLKGGFLSVPMINYPEVAILGVHLIRDMPVVVDDQVKIGKVLPFSLTFDHRVVDGADAVLFGNALIKYLEDPDFMQML